VIGEVIGNYRIVSELGKGGMGVVYFAEHVQLGRPVALKMLLPQMSASPIIVQRFFNEARAASAIEHPGIVEIFDFGRHTDGSAYIVMALLRGESLDHRLLYGALPPLEGASLIAQVAAALAAAHACNIIHRDLKPDNIFLVPNELMPNGTQVKLLDFGIAKLADEQTAGFKTQTGVMLGTPAYMSPEQCMGRSDLDHRTDLYSLGCILFHVLTGRPPFLSDHGTGVMIAAHMRDPAPHPRSLNANIPDALAAITMRLLEKDPAARFQTATDVRAALVAAGAHAPMTKPGVDPLGSTMVSAPGLPSAAPSAVPPIAHPASIATAPTTATTASGSAAEVVAPRPPKGKSGVWIAIGVVTVLAGIGGGVVFAVANKSDEPTVAAAEPSPSPASPPAPTPRPASPSTPPEVKPENPAALLATTDACPTGQVRGGDTQGHCCWRDQAWSSAKNRCIGAPNCPSGMVARGEQCTGTAPQPQPAKPVGESPLAIAATSFRLNAKSFALADDIAITFPNPVRSPSNSRAWVCIAAAGKPASSYVAWTFVDDGATTATLEAPKKAGAYELRLHTEYPDKPHNVQHAVPFTVRDNVEAPPTPASQATPRSLQRFTLASTRIPAGGKVQLRFPSAMRALPGERFWATVVARDAADNSWGSYEYVPDGAKALQLPVPSNAGEYEVRLHANYPKQTTNVVHRIAIDVE
jgi:serine/threonine-protein kinase